MRYFFLIFFAVVGYLSFLILKPFLNAIFGSIFLAFMFYPLYKWLYSKTKRKNTSALIIAFIVLLIVSIVATAFAGAISNQVRDFYVSSKEKLVVEDIFVETCNEQGSFVCKISNSINDFWTNPKTKVYADAALSKINSYAVSKASGIVFSIPIIILNFFLALFITFYLLRDGPAIVNMVKRSLPLKKSYQDKIINKFKEVTSGILYGQLLIALIQGVLGGIGFAIFGVKSPILWGVVMTVLALIPMVGPPMIYIPAVILMAINGFISHETSLIWKAGFLLAYCLLIVSTVDNFLRPKLVADKAKIHPVLVLLGVLGGIEVFGFMGFIMGPMVLALLIVLWSIYCSSDKIEA